MSNTDYEAYNEAAHLASTQWGQGELYNSRTDKYCLVGAVGKARGLSLYSEFDLPKRDIKALNKILRWKPSYWLPPVMLATLLAGIGAAMAVGLGANPESAVFVWLGVTTALVSLFHLGFRQLQIELWNDTPGRTEEEVVKVLTKIADQVRPAWLEDEALRLSIETSHLRAQIAELQARLALAEAENQRLWRKALGVSSLQSDRDQLKELEAELAEKAARMQTLELEQIS